MEIQQLIFQSGAAGVGVYAIYVMQKIISNHLAHNTRAVEKNTEVLGILEKTINKLAELIERKL
jgi:hypothetical protein